MKLWADERQSPYSTGVVPVILQRVAHALYLICEIVTYRYPPLLSLPFVSGERPRVGGFQLSGGSGDRGKPWQESDVWRDCMTTLFSLCSAAADPICKLCSTSGIYLSLSTSHRQPMTGNPRERKPDDEKGQRLAEYGFFMIDYPENTAVM